MIGKFTKRLQKIILNAQREAKDSYATEVGIEHLILGLITLKEGIAYEYMSQNGINISSMEEHIRESFSYKSSPDADDSIVFSIETKKLLSNATKAAKQADMNFVGTEHLLVAMLKSENETLNNLMEKSGGNKEELLQSLFSSMKIISSSGGITKKDTPMLKQYGRNLTDMAQKGELDPVIGRKGEIQRLVQILARRTKNNPVLIGEAGVGKTAIVEGLAQRIVNKDVPEILNDKQVVSLDMAAMIAGTKYRGEFEKRLKACMVEINERKGEIVLFLDELHTIIGAGASEGAMDASNMLKPALGRGELQCIGATTLDEYRKHIEKDAALTRRFQQVVVEQPNAEDAIEIMNGIKDVYEEHHGISITDDAIKASVELTQRYIGDRFLPDKSIDVIDEAGSKARLNRNVMPDSIRKQEEEVSRITAEKNEAISIQDFEGAAKLRDTEKAATAALKNAKTKWNKSAKTDIKQITREDIAEIIADWTGIPIKSMNESESAKLMKMEGILHEKIIGQDEAVTTISKAIRRARAGLHSTNKPIGSFIFLGPTGVGKTELARTLSDYMFEDPDAMIRIDMSEYMEKFNISRLIGAPPGYVGYDEGGVLTEAVRRKPYSVVLLDEIEKAHPEVFNILLQIMDNGQITDSLGHNVSFRNCVIIMTSNMGISTIKQKAMGFNSGSENAIEYEQAKTKILAAVKQNMRPEFINRVDDMIVFHPLDKKHIKKIVGLMIDDLNNRIKESEYYVSLTNKATDFIIEKGYDPEYGARPLQRTIRRYIEDELSERILMNEVKKGEINISVKDGNIVFKNNGK